MVRNTSVNNSEMPSTVAGAAPDLEQRDPFDWLARNSPNASRAGDGKPINRVRQLVFANYYFYGRDKFLEQRAMIGARSRGAP
jgi:hypothetical protein